jgi:hypothetical protein
MKTAVINFSGNVGKSTVARHLLLPRVPGAELVTIESLNADESKGQALRGRQFGELQEYPQTVFSVVVDIGASNVEELMGQMQRYRGSHEDFDAFVVPTVAASSTALPKSSESIAKEIAAFLAGHAEAQPLRQEDDRQACDRTSGVRDGRGTRGTAEAHEGSQL